MTTEQESIRGMHFSVRDYLEPKAEITKDLPEFVANFADYKVVLSRMDKISELQNFDKTGLAKEKAQLQDVLIMLAKVNSVKLASFAKISKNTVMMTEVKFTKTKLIKAPDTVLKDYSQMIYDKAQANLGSLGAYGITQETQGVLLNAINAYTISIARPRLGIAELSQATKHLAELFRTADNLLGEIDAAMNVLITSQPDIYNGYYNVRKVVVTGKKRLALKGAASELNGSPLKGVRFTFVPDGGILMAGNGAISEIVKMTAKKGNFYIKNMPEGIYKVRVTKTGYKEKIVSVSVAAGELASLSVELEKL
jgi:hypothetical protein